MKIEQTKIGKTSSPFIVAEMSGNHNQSLEKALAIVEAAAKTGVDALKLQTYTADTITINSTNKDFQITDKNSLWQGQILYNLYKKAHTPWEWHKKIFERCKELGLICFSTPFDETAVDFLEALNVPCYKLASFEITHIPLIKKIAQTKKPIIMSTGMATISEIEEAVTTAQTNGCKDIILLKCTSSYPAPPEEANLRTIPHMKDLFKCQVGLSDHTLGIGTSVASIALGATVIEKHFTLSRSEGGVDSVFSIEPHEMKTLVEETNRAWKSLGIVNYKPTLKEKKSLKFRRSIYASKEIKQGEVFSQDNIKIIRPGYGLAPKHFEKILKQKSTCNIKQGTALKENMVQN